VLQIPPELAKGHASATKTPEQLAVAWAETFEYFGRLQSSDRVLDIGCGPGRMAIGIGERFGWTNDYLGFEIKREDVAFAQAEITSRHPGFRFVHLDIANGFYNPQGAIDPTDVRFPADDGSADFAFATSVFTHMTASSTEHYLAEARRVVRAGGTLFATFFLLNDASEMGSAAGNSRFHFQHPYGGGLVLFPDRPLKGIAFPLQWAVDAFRQAGFKKVEHYQGASTGYLQGRHAQNILIGR
jgi:SAM-dependent methyltransferase